MYRNSKIGTKLHETVNLDAYLFITKRTKINA